VGKRSVEIKDEAIEVHEGFRVPVPRFRVQFLVSSFWFLVSGFWFLVTVPARTNEKLETKNPGNS